MSKKPHSQQTLETAVWLAADYSVTQDEKVRWLNALSGRKITPLHQDSFGDWLGSRTERAYVRQRNRMLQVSARRYSLLIVVFLLLVFVSVVSAFAINLA